MNRNWIIAAIAAVLLAGCGTSQPEPGEDNLPPEGVPPATCRVPLPERIGTRTLRKGPDSCDVHYVFTNQTPGNARLVVNGNLRIEPGTILEFDENTLLSVDRLGSLNATGTAAEPVVLRGAQATHGYWYGICFDNNEESTLDHVHILYGGHIWGPGETPLCEGAVSGGAGTANNSEPVRISNSLIMGSAVSGVNGFNLNLGEFRNNVLADNQGFPIRIQAQHASSLDASNDFTGTSMGLPNGDGRVFLWGTLRDSHNEHIWTDLGVPWYVGESGRSRYGTSVNIWDDTTLQIQAGSRFEFGSGTSSSLNAWDGARILIRGTATQPVVMDAVEQTPGSWQGLTFSNAGKSELEHVEIRWAGNPDGLYVGSPGAVHVYLSSLVMQQSIIHGSGSCAVSIANLHEGQTIDLQVEVQEHHSGKPELCSDV